MLPTAQMPVPFVPYDASMPNEWFPVDEPCPLCGGRSVEETITPGGNQERFCTECASDGSKTFMCSDVPCSCSDARRSCEWDWWSPGEDEFDGLTCLWLDGDWRVTWHETEAGTEFAAFSECEDAFRKALVPAAQSIDPQPEFGVEVRIDDDASPAVERRFREAMDARRAASRRWDAAIADGEELLAAAP